MSPGLTPRAFGTLLLLACLFGANHVAARLALDHGVDVATAVAARSGVTALVVAAIVWRMGVRVSPTPLQWRWLAVIALGVAAQSFLIYSAVARIPVALALLAFNTYPLMTAMAVWARYGHRPPRAVLLVSPVLLAGLALALDATGAASGLTAQAQWGRIGTGVACGLGAAFVFGWVLAFTQHEVAALDGRFRTLVTMAAVGTLAGVAALVQGGFHWPNAPAGWWGLCALSVLYGTAFTIMFSLLPRLGVVGSSPIMNVEPVAALVLAWALLGQTIAPLQLVGAFIVVGAVMALGLRRG
ncbi:putative permease, DMT superfamily [Burkholderiales bacterium JOSHI_001]|nr:putative permease, DMT superfamily [Burkholderiales bacterium JOSHI_001]